MNTASLIDSLVYGYNANSNQLSYVTDKQNDAASLLGDFKEVNNNTTADYTYDGNGNLTADNNKSIAAICYNYLNLPDSIAMTGKGYIRYMYDAGGIKQQKITVDNAAGKKTVITYTGAFNYQYSTTLTGTAPDTLQYISMEEGRMRPKGTNSSDTVLYDFFEKDHLGNVRVVLTDEKRQDVYPAATLENAAGIALQSAYYTINTADTISTSRIAWWNSTMGKGYPNNNGNPPYNTDYTVNTSAVSNVVYKLNGNTGDNVKKHQLSISLNYGVSGYLYVYCSNESNVDVYFDNMQVIQTRGPLLETNSYYPFGLTMSGISSKAAGGITNRMKYNGKEEQRQEFSDGSGLELYCYSARLRNPQLSVA